MERKTVTVDDVIRRHISAHSQSYYPWIRHLVTLATGSLTALISLQGQYLPTSPQARWLLVVGLSALISTVLLGLLALREEYALPLRRASEILDTKMTKGENAAAELIGGAYGAMPNRQHYWYVHGLVFAFALSMVCLVFFVASNVL